MKIFDAHFHIINPNYPLVKNNGYLPPTFTVDQYEKETNKFNICGGAVVSGSFQAFNQAYLIDALPKLGSNYCGVANIPVNV
jgi:predicted TIM-barrel fold metal-dependent hydrolase